MLLGGRNKHGSSTSRQHLYWLYHKKLYLSSSTCASCGTTSPFQHLDTWDRLE
ncbi:jg24187, partial [Pararge aegeria aegeria]